MGTGAYFRADHVGSLLRPPDLLAARRQHQEGRLSLAELRQREDQAIAAVVTRQQQMGLSILTDGELRRSSWLASMADAVDGFVADNILLEWRGPGGGAEKSAAKIVGGRLQKRRMLSADEAETARQFGADRFKVTLPAPSNFVLAGFKPGVTDQHYNDRDELLADLVAIVRDEIEWLIAQGVTYIQLDAPFYSHYLDPQQRGAIESTGGNPDDEFRRAVAGDNRAIEGLRRNGLTLAMHICRGNSRSRWYTEGGYDAIAETLFAELDVDRFLLEYDSTRAGGFDPLRLVPSDKTVVLGLVTTKEPALESEDELKRRIDDAARRLPIERLALSPQCGFASVAEGNLLSEEDQWRKLDLVVRVARAVWSDS